MNMYSFLLENAPIVVMVAIIMFIIGKFLFASKKDIEDFDGDLHKVSKKIDGGFSSLDMKIVTNNHNTTQAFSEKLVAQQKEIMDEVYKKFLTKEMSEKQEQMNKDLVQRQEHRLDKLESGLEYIRQKVDKNEVDNQINSEKLENILDILKRKFD